MDKPEKINDSLSLFSLRGSLDFGTDAYLLSAYIKKSKSGIFAELGAGNGVISMLCAAQGKAKHITAFEIQPSLADIAAKNVDFNHLSDKIKIICGDARSAGNEYNGKFDTVFSNPPYLRTGTGLESENESARICRREVTGGIADFSAVAARLLRFGGSFVCVYRPDRMAEMIYSMRKNGIEPKRVTLVYPTENHVPCLVLCEGVKGGGEGVFFTRPLMIYKSKDNMSQSGYTDEMNYIYTNGDFNGYYKKP